MEARRLPHRQLRRHHEHPGFSSGLQGFGYFQNVGSTRRQGIEAEAKLNAKSFEFNSSYTFIDARFLDSLELGSNSPSRTPSALSRSRQATRFPRSRAIASSSAPTTPSPMPSRSASTLSI